MGQPVVDIKGQRFGQLIVLEENGRTKDGKVMWLCQCDCGNTKTICGCALRKKDGTKSCGCLRKRKPPNFSDLTGQCFHQLAVLKQSGKDKYGNAKWLCQCSCGKTTEVGGFSLKSGNTKSCGCLNKFPEGIAARNDLLGRYKRDAIDRNLIWELTGEQFHELTQGDCFYCRTEPLQIHKNRNNNGDYIYNGIDRVDNSKGYLLDNCVPCCGTCNKMKNSGSLDEFLDQVERISQNMKTKRDYQGRWK